MKLIHKSPLILAAFAGLALSANAAVTISAGTPIASFEFTPGGQTGDVVHGDGLQMNGWTGAWGGLTGNTSSEVSATSGTPTVTFRWNVGGAAQTWGWSGGTTPPVRNTYAYVNNPARYLGAVPWRIEGLTPDTPYDIIMYGTARNFPTPDPSTALFSIPGFDAGNGVGNPVTLDTEGDGNFLSVVADGSGNISGFFDGTTAGEARVTGMQIAQVPEPTAAALLGIGGLLMLRRRRK